MIEANLQTASDTMDLYCEISLKTGPKTVKKCIRRCPAEETIGSIINTVIEEANDIQCTRKVKSINGLKSDKGKNVAEFPVTLEQFMPCSILASFDIRYIDVLLDDVDDSASSCETHATNAFTVLMSLKRSYTWFPPEKEERTKKDKLYNDFCKLIKNKFEVGFLEKQQDMGKNIINTLVDVIWYMDPLLDKFHGRGLHIPNDLQFSGYRDLVAQHKKAIQLNAAELEKYLGKLSTVMLLPWWMNTKFSKFREIVQEYVKVLEECIKKMKSQQLRTNQCHKLQEPVRALNDNWSLQTIEGSSLNIQDEYNKLMADLNDANMYEALCLLEYEPKELSSRRRWRRNLENNISYSVSMFVATYGNYCGNISFLWKLPPKSERTVEQEFKAVTEVKQLLPVYSTRTMRKDFFEKFSCLKLRAHEMRAIYYELTEYENAPENKKSQAIDNRFLMFIANCDDDEIIVDLRKNNGRAKDERLDPFWHELQKYLDEHTVVHERRHHSTSYMPFAISATDLIAQIRQRLPLDTPTPSPSWLRFNFMPTNPERRTAANYTGKFNVKYAVQQRLLRSQHDDASYGFHMYLLLKSMAVMYREHSYFQSLDDKAVVPLGEPNNPVSTGVKAHNAGLTMNAKRHGILALDHDYKLAGVVPSVHFGIDIPTDRRDSFYRGKIHVTLKNKVYEASSPYRHAAENVRVVRANSSSDGVISEKPIIFKYTDGGPDHRTNYRSVKIGTLLEFLALDADMIVCVRTAPQQSYNNPAERTMSILNLALQNVSLSRTPMTDSHERKASQLKTLADLRKHADRFPEFKEAYLASVAEPINLLRNRFERLTMKEEPVQVYTAATDDEIEMMKRTILCLDENYNINAMEGFETSEIVSKFLKDHSRSRQYSFQLKKCKNFDCMYCTVFCPPRLPEDVFKELDYLPDAVLNNDKEYKTFKEVYRTETTDRDRPALINKPEPTDRDKNFKKLLVGGKVRAYIDCTDCNKRRVIYSTHKLTPAHENALKRLKEEIDYSCGSTLFPAGPLQDSLIVREGINCSSPIETTYYAGITVKFSAICFYCSTTDVIPEVADILKQFKEKYSVVRPICQHCIDAGKEPATRNQLQGPKR